MTATRWKKTPESRKLDAERYGTAWRRARLAALRSARWRCEIRLDGCQGAATEVDHVTGAANDPRHQHLRAACKACHAKVTAQQGNDAKRERGRPSRDPASQPRTRW